jgi:WD40 repeat protein
MMSRKCIIWDIGMNEPMEVFEDQEKEIMDIDFNPMGNKLATGSGDGSVCVYNTNVGTLEYNLLGHEREVTKVKFSSQGDFLLSTGFDGIGRIWRS